MTSDPAGLLRQHGIQITAQRLAVLRAVAVQPHATASGIAEVVRTEIGAISLQSVYDALDLLAAEGLNLGVDHNASMHLLGHAALSMHLVFHPEKSPAEQISEIDATVALIRARSQAQALAS